jgi:ligand-binding sensor protein
MRLIWAVMAGLLLVAAPIVADDDPSGVCLGGMEIVVCVPPEGA